MSGTISDISGIVNGISGSLSAAMNFTNLSVNIFGCDLGLSCPASDYYTLQEGSGGSEESQLPKIPAVAASAQNKVVPVKTTEQVPFATPTSETKPVVYSDNRVGQQDPQSRNVVNAEGEIQRSNRTPADREAVRGTLQF